MSFPQTKSQHAEVLKAVHVDPHARVPASNPWLWHDWPLRFPASQTSGGFSKIALPQSQHAEVSKVVQVDPQARVPPSNPSLWQEWPLRFPASQISGGFSEIVLPQHVIAPQSIMFTDPFKLPTFPMTGKPFRLEFTSPQSRMNSL